MYSRLSATVSSALAGLMLFLTVAPAWAQTANGALVGGNIVIMRKGQTSPNDGLLLDEAAADKMVEDLRDLKSSRSIVETQKGALATKDQQIEALTQEITELKAQVRSQEIALALSDERENKRTEHEKILMTLVDESRKTLVDAREQIKQDRDRIEKLEQRQFWLMLLGPIAFGIGYLLFGL